MIVSMKKHDYAYVKDYFSTHDCQLLSFDYVGAHVPLDYKCSCGTVSKINFTNFQQGKRCRKCGSREVTKETRLNFEYVKIFFATHGCELLEESYKNNSTPLKYRCVCGTVSKIRFGNFQQGKRCRKCAVESMSGDGNVNWNPNREQIKLTADIRRKYYRALTTTLQSTGKKKKTRSRDLLGYRPNDLREHIQKHENWNAVKETRWHLDHIFPIKAFIDLGITDPKIINCLENLRPLSAHENVSKHDDYDLEQFKQWILLKRK
jgi:hypothetical protein